MRTKHIALENRLRKSDIVISLGVRPNLADYEDWQLALIRDAPVIYYPTAFYADIFDSLGKRTFPGYHTYKYAQDKIKQTALFGLMDVRHPRTRVFYGKRQKSKILKHFDFPFVAKVARGSALGMGVFLIRNENELEAYLDTGGPAYIQEYIDIPKDLRVVVVGGKAVHAYWRIARKGEFRTNVSQGATLSMDDIPDEAVAFAVDVAGRCRVDDVGLDIYSHAGDYGVLEMNMKYGKAGFRKAGIDYDQMMEKMIKNDEI